MTISPGIAKSMLPLARRAEAAGLHLACFNSGKRRNESNGFRLFRGTHARDFFKGTHIAHLADKAGVEAYLNGFGGAGAKRFSAEGNKGGSYVTLSRTDKEDVVLVEVGEQCVAAPAVAMDVTLLAAAILYAKQVGYEKVLMAAGWDAEQAARIVANGTAR